MDRIFGCFTKFLEKKNFSTFAQITLLHECLLKLNTLLLSMYKLLKSDLVFFPPRFERICLATSDTFFIVLSLAKKLVMRDKGEWLIGPVTCKFMVQYLARRAQCRSLAPSASRYALALHPLHHTRVFPLFET